MSRDSGRSVLKAGGSALLLGALLVPSLGFGASAGVGSSDFFVKAMNESDSGFSQIYPRLSYGTPGEDSTPGGGTPGEETTNPTPEVTPNPNPSSNPSVPAKPVTPAASFGWSTNKSTREAAIVGFQGTDTDIVVPATYVQDGIEYKVTRINADAFMAKGLTSVELPDSISSILGNAFQGNKLTSIKLPDSLVSLGSSAFQDNELKSVEINRNLSRISIAAFMNNQIESVYFPDNVTNTSDNSFKNNRLTSVRLSPAMTRIERGAFENNLLTSIDIPDGTTFIGGNSLRNNLLESVVLPSKLITIEYHALRSNRLSSVAIPPLVKSIGDSAFADNGDLTAVTLSGPAPTTISGVFGSPTKVRVTVSDPSTYSSYKLTSAKTWNGYSLIMQ